jgi:hypothetical protein
MKPEEINLAIAEACGWTYYHDDAETIVVGPKEVWPESHPWKERGLVKGDGRPDSPLVDISGLPSYYNDLNACHEMEAVLRNLLMRGFRSDGIYEKVLTAIVSKSGRAWHATAPQRCEAFLRTIGKWKD